MVLQRKLRIIGDSLVLTIPSSVAKLIKYNEGDMIDFTLIDGDRLLLKKVIN